MRNRFCVLILTNNRPDRVHTVKTLNKHGYTGAWFLVIDDEDPTANEYKKNSVKSGLLYLISVRSPSSLMRRIISTIEDRYFMLETRHSI